MILGFVLLCFPLSSACGSNSAAAVTSPSYPALPSPTYGTLSPELPPALPAQARIVLTASWDVLTNSLGDVSEDLVVSVDSNIPVEFDGYFDNVLLRGVNIISGPTASPTAVAPYEKAEWRLHYAGRFPKGTYEVHFDVLSYVSDQTQFGVQTTAYNQWVGGDRGPLLQGNPQAIVDESHAAVLDLRAVARIVHG